LSEFVSPLVYNADVFINCAAAKVERTANDRFVNATAPVIFCDIAARASGCHFIHISSFNVLIPRLVDPYTLSKRRAEAALAGRRVTILRPGLIWSWQPEGNAVGLDKILRLPLPFLPMIYPGNTYRPILVEQFAAFLVTEAERSEPRPLPLSVLGDRPVNF